MRILVVGAGATGGFYGGKLVKAGRDVTFLLRERRAAEIRERGLQVLSPDGDFTVTPKVISAGELKTYAEVFDLILLSPKAYQLEGAMDDIAPAVQPETMILPILNGMRQFDMLSGRFGKERVLGGSVRVVADVDPEGRVRNMTTLDEMNYGELSGERTPRIEAVHRVLSSAGFTANLQADILATLWQKWWILASMGTICVLAGGTIGQTARTPYGKEFALAVLQESTAIATANGFPPDPAMYTHHKARYTDDGSSLTSSMYRDLRRGAPVEADHILGDLLSRRKDVEAPLLTAAYTQLKVYEAARSA